MGHEIECFIRYPRMLRSRLGKLDYPTVLDAFALYCTVRTAQFEFELMFFFQSNDISSTEKLLGYI